jgi:hypothetical protein
MHSPSRSSSAWGEGRRRARSAGAPAGRRRAEAVGCASATPATAREARLQALPDLPANIALDGQAGPEQPLQSQLCPAPMRDLVERPARSDSAAREAAVAQAIESRQHCGVAIRCRSRMHGAQRPSQLVRSPRLDREQQEHERTERTSAHPRIQSATTPSGAPGP